MTEKKGSLSEWVERIHDAHQRNPFGDAFPLNTIQRNILVRYLKEGIHLRGSTYVYVADFLDIPEAVELKPSAEMDWFDTTLNAQRVKECRITSREYAFALLATKTIQEAVNLVTLADFPIPEATEKKKSVASKSTDAAEPLSSSAPTATSSPT